MQWVSLPGANSTPTRTNSLTMDSYRPLAASPELHQDWSDPQEERSATWPELFTDLYFVAAISNLSHLFHDHPDAPNAGRIVLYHALVFFLWAEYTMLKTRFKLRGLMFRFGGLGMQLGLLGLIIGTRTDMEWYRLIAGGYAISRASLSCSHGIVAWTIPRARGLCLANAVSGLVLSVAPAVLAWQATDCEAYTLHVAIMAVVTVGEAAILAIPTMFPSIDIPLHVEHMNERLGQLVMLHLGEAVIGIAATPLESTTQQFVGVALAATLVWALHLDYYHVEADKDRHAYKQSRFRGLLFFYGHWLLLLALLFTGSGLRLLLGMYPGPHHAHEEPLAPWDTTLLLCTAYAASLHLVGLTRAAHYFSFDRRHGVVRSVERKGVKGWWLAWWGLVVVWPLPVYFLPLLVHSINGDYGMQFTDAVGADVYGKGLVHGRVTVTMLLAVLAAHKVVLTCAESLFAHMITKTPVLEPVGAPDGPAEGHDC